MVLLASSGHELAGHAISANMQSNDEHTGNLFKDALCSCFLKKKCNNQHKSQPVEHMCSWKQLAGSALLEGTHSQVANAPALAASMNRSTFAWPFFCACRSYPTKHVSSPFLGESGRKTAAIPTGVPPRGQGDRNTLAHYPAIPRGSTRGTATCGQHHLQECLGRSWHARSQLCLTGKFRSETDGPYRNTNIMMNSCWALLAAG